MYSYESCNCQNTSYIVHSFKDIYGFVKSRTKKVECFCKVQKNTDEVGGKREYFTVNTIWSIGETGDIYSSRVRLTLKVGLKPMESTQV